MNPFRISRFFSGVFCFLSLIQLAACSVSIQQVAEARRLLPSELGGRRDRDVREWVLKFAGADLPVTAETKPDGMVIFSNTSGVQVE